MCLAIPGKVLELRGADVARSGRVQFGGIARDVNFCFVPEARVGDYVVVHVGFAISIVDAEDARRTYDLLESMDQLEADAAVE